MIKIRILVSLCLYIFIMTAAPGRLAAQCPSGYNQVTLNWDNLDYFIYQNNYTTTNGYLPSVSWAQTQNFAFGTQRLTITNNYAAANIEGDVSIHTGEAGSYGVGDDIQFTGDGVITLTFENEVQNLKFSMYDVDRSQRIRFDARNGANALQSVTLTRLGGGSSILTTSNGTAAQAQAAANTNVANNLVTASFNVDITGPVKTVTITVDQTAANASEDGSFFISDIIACSAGNFPTSYYAASRPFTGQPGYVLHAMNKGVYALNPATGVTKLLFTDPYVGASGGNWYINSMAYDPYKHYLYYVYSLTNDPGTNAMLKRYDANTGNITTLLADISTIGIPYVKSNSSGNTTRGIGVESGAAAFYNGALYIGIETTTKSGLTTVSGNSNRETVIYRIDLNASDIPYRSSQVFAMPVDNGSGTLTHDWSDFVFNDGMLYDFDGAGAGSETDIYHVNLLTGATTNFSDPATSYSPSTDRFVPGQPTLDWTGAIYNITATGPGNTVITPYVAAYNTATGRLGTRFNLTSTPSYPASPSIGDAAEAFRPLCDFGDAPATYDPVALSPAVNEIDSTLRLGANLDREFNKWTSALADGDGSDEDGVPTVTILATAWSTYHIQADVYNNTGANATLIGWLDYNGNGVFDAGEASGSQTVPSSTIMQSIHLYWTGMSCTLPVGSYTYLRLRLTSASYGMTAANATGWYNNGETEDYRVPIQNVVLPVTLADFNARISNRSQVNLQWSAADETGLPGYTLQRSADGVNWSAVTWMPVEPNVGRMNQYAYMDVSPLPGISYYRLQMKETAGSIHYSKVREVHFDEAGIAVSLSPNPASSHVNCSVSNLVSGEEISLFVYNSQGTCIYKASAVASSRNFATELPVSAWPRGSYRLIVKTGKGRATRQLILQP